MMHVIRRFTLAEFWERAAEPNKNPEACTGSRGSDSNGKYWGDAATYEDSMELARHGWAKGAQRTAEVADSLAESVQHDIPSPQLVYDVIGDTPDVGAFIAGVPEHMLSIQDMPSAQRVVRIVVACGAGTSTPSETFTARGAVICAAIDAIERAGVRCEIVAGKMTRWSRLKWEAYITIKRAEEPLNVARVAYCLAHPSFFRRQLWHCYETEERAVLAAMGSAMGGYGRTNDCETDRGDLYIPAMRADENWTDPAQAVKRAIDMIRKVGVTVGE